MVFIMDFMPRRPCLGIWDLGSGVNRMRCEWCVHGEKGITIEE